MKILLRLALALAGLRFRGLDWLRVLRCRCGLVTMLAMISVSAGYGTDGSSTPITVALRVPS